LSIDARHRARGAALAAAVTALATLSLAWSCGSASASPGPYIGGFGTTAVVASAVPASGPAAGDVNPYGVAVVPRSAGDLVRGDVLVSNFNDAANEQGTGSSIVEISPSGAQHVFAVVPAPTDTPAVGLTTALVALRSGFVIVGSLPAPGGMSSSAGFGALTILDRNGNVVGVLKGGNIRGPWDMTAIDHGRRVTLFVTDVLNGTVHAGGATIHDGTVLRISLELSHDRWHVVADRVIGTGFAEHTDPDALVVGPTGVAVGADGTLYVADSVHNRIAAIPGAVTRMTALGGGGLTVSEGGALNDPLGLLVAPGGDIVSANGGNGKLVETSPAGTQVAVKDLVQDGAGDLFGLALIPDGHGLYFVNDAGSGPAANSLDSLR
jgi:NHL repeat